MDGMVCNVWLRMSLTGEERGQRSDRVVKAAREDGAEKCGVIYVFDPGSIQGSHRPISFIRIKHRTRADDILCKTEY